MGLYRSAIRLIRTHDRLEFGTTHAIAAAADWLKLAAMHRDDFENRLICYGEAADHLAFDSLRQPSYRYSEAGQERFESSAFLAAAEEEDAHRAEAMVARGLADGLHWPDRFLKSPMKTKHVRRLAHQAIDLVARDFEV